MVYEGVLKEDRIKLHERVGLAIEQIFADRLTEYYETLAFHFQRGQSFYKALNYLIKAGEKCLNLYSLKESDAFFQDAFDLISSVSDKTERDKEILTDVLVKWSLLYYYNGHIDDQYQLLIQYENMVETLKDQSRRGMFKAWMGWTLWMNGKPKQARQYLFEAFKIGEEIDNKRVISYSLTWLSWCLLDSGEFNQSKQFALKANKLSLSIGPDHYCYFKPLGAIAQACWFTGDWQTCKNVGIQLVKYGEKCTNSRCLVAGNISLGMASALIGEFDQSIYYFCLAAEVSRDPFYYYWSRGHLGTAYLLSQQTEEADEPVNESHRYCYDYGAYSWGHLARMLFGLLLIFQGNMSKGLNILEQANQVCVQHGRIPFRIVAEYFIGKVYLELVLPSNAIRLSELLKNSLFLLKISRLQQRVRKNT